MSHPTYMGLGAPEQIGEVLSTASTATTVSYSQAFKPLFWPGHSGAARIILPQPKLGVWFDIYFLAASVSSATRVGPTTNYDVISVGTTANYVAPESTALENGNAIRLIGISDTRYMAIPIGGSTDQTLQTLTS